MLPDDWQLTVAGAAAWNRWSLPRPTGSPRFSFLGYISESEKERFFDEIDVLVIPSEWEEPAALVGTEAAARGIPTIVSDRGGIPELPEASVFPARDVDASALRSRTFADDT